MTPADLTVLLAQPGIERHADGSLTGPCNCGGSIWVRRPDDEGIAEAVARHNGSLLHMKARRAWSLWNGMSESHLHSDTEGLAQAGRCGKMSPHNREVRAGAAGLGRAPKPLLGPAAST